MRILVVGAGAVGGYFGARLVAGGADVTFAVRSGTEAVLRESGLRVHSPLGDLHLQEPRLLDRESDAPFDLVLICTKLRDLEGGIDIAEEHLASEGLVAAMQNGVESEDRLKNRLGAKRVLGAVAYIAAALERPGVVRHTGEMARLVVGLPGGGSHPVLDSLMAACRRAGIEAEVAADIEAAIWRKFVFLAPFAGLTASWRQAIGPLREKPNAWAFYGNLVREAVAVARARKVNLPEDAADQVLTFTRGLPDGMKASMLHDLEAGRPLELHWLTGAVARLGAELGVETPASSSVTAELQRYADGTA
ncbi:ketopantoate reductase family protein [Aquibaculum sediminis]|uniref:ketopantoate reductase family protein n=1 Tax=Aquibaculum sediminis TaxID=3231907 RepID=UPI0034523071